MKELYQQAVATSERVTKINPADEIQCTTAHARSIKEKFERGEPITCSNEDEADSNSTSNKIKQEKPDEDVIAAGKTFFFFFFFVVIITIILNYL